MNAANQRVRVPSLAKSRCEVSHVPQPQEAADAGAAPKQSYYVNVQGIRFQKPEDESTSLSLSLSLFPRIVHVCACTCTCSCSCICACVCVCVCVWLIVSQRTRPVRTGLRR